MTTSKIEMPPDIHWEELNGILYPSGSVEIWGTDFHVDAIEVNEAGEAITAEGAKMLRLLNELDGGDEGHLTSIDLKPGRQFVVHFYPCRSYDSEVFLK